LFPANVPFLFERSVEFVVTIGEQFGITGALAAEAIANASAVQPGDETSFLLADAFRTANFYFQPLDDFTLVAASGHDYSPPSTPTAVPEPGSLTLFVGIAALGTARRRLFYLLMTSCR
jgi:hypothetical protein